jgi:hypothetical protein
MMKLPFDCAILDKAPIEVRNPYSGETCVLTPEAVAVYDTITGAQMFNDFETVRKGLDWFIENYPKEYMILLD